jgi:hypothetical protein
MKVNMTINNDQGGMIMATDEDQHYTLHVTVAGGSGDTTVNVIYGAKR